MTQLGLLGQELSGRDTNIFYHKLIVYKCSHNIRLPLTQLVHITACHFSKKSVVLVEMSNAAWI